MKHRKFAIVGGDSRSIYLAKHLIGDKHSVTLFGFSNYSDESLNFSTSLDEALENADIVICPIPCSRNNVTLNNQFHNDIIKVEDVFKQMKPLQIFIAGYISSEIEAIAKHYNIQTFDVLKKEEMSVLNAIPTSEGALQIAFQEMDTTLHNSNTMVIGYGRIGKVLTKMLQGIGANVYAVSRTQEHLAYIEACGYQPVLLDNMSDYLAQMDVIFNTAPHILLDKSNLGLLQKHCLVIDLASKPFGIDFEYAKICGVKAISALSLPGKVAPCTAACYILNTIYHFLSTVT